MIAFKCSGIESLCTLVLETEGKKDSNSNEIHEKEENVRKLVFLTDPGLRDMSRISIEADAKRKFDMLEGIIQRLEEPVTCGHCGCRVTVRRK